MSKKQGKRKKDYTFMRRRLLLLLVVILLAAVAVWLAMFRKDPIFPPQEPTSSSEPEVSSEPEASSEPEPEPEPESDPEPEEEAVSTSDWNLRLAGPNNPLPEGYAPPELATVVDAYKVDSRILDDVLRMFAKAKEEGIDLMVCSAYRSEEYQRELFENNKNQHIQNGKTEEEAIAATSLLLTPPGSSEHQTGLALDIVTPEYQSLDDGFEQTPAFRWLQQNAAEFGFILRYPKDKQNLTNISYEPWHYRYVGTEHAKRINEQKYCLEEYLYVALMAEQAAAQAAEEAAAAAGTSLVEGEASSDLS